MSIFRKLIIDAKYEYNKPFDIKDAKNNIWMLWIAYAILFAIVLLK